MATDAPLDLRWRVRGGRLALQRDPIADAGLRRAGNGHVGGGDCGREKESGDSRYWMCVCVFLMECVVDGAKLSFHYRLK